MSLTPVQQALYANRVTRDCLLAADGDVGAALAAAEYIVATQPMPDEVEIEQDAEDENGDPPVPVDLSIDIHGVKHKEKGPGGGQFAKKGEERYDIEKTWRSKWIEGLEDSEKEAIEEYTLNSDKINSALRSGTLGGNSAYTVSDLDAAIEKSVLPHDVLTYRGLTSDPDWEIGEEIEELGYTSVSKSLHTAIDFADQHGEIDGKGVLIEVVLPKGTLAIDVGTLSPSYASEGEVLTARGTRSKVVGKREEKGRIIYRIELSTDVTTPALSLNTFLSFDIHNRQAQGILNRTLQAAKGLTATARKDLAAALKQGATGNGEAILNFIDKYRVQLAKLLTTTQLAAVLEGAREVAAKVPTLANFPGAIPPPPTLEPQKAVALIERLEKLTEEKRVEEVYKLPATEQAYVRQAIAARAAPPPTVPPIVPQHAEGGAPEDIHYPIIEEAIKNLQERNVMDRRRYDALNAAARAKAFTVANVQAQETLTKIRDSLAESAAEGADYETWRKKVLADVDQGTFLSDAHQETVYRTNIQTGFSDGQEAVLQHPLVRSGFPYRARDAIHDDRVRKNHLALEKLGIQGTNIYRADDPVWQLFRVPWDYNDRCADTALTVRQAAEAGIKEAQRWLEAGVEPADKAFVKMPDFRPPEGFQRAVAAAPLSVQLSLQPVVTFSTTKPDEETETSLLYGQPEVGGIASATLDTAKEPKSTKVGRHTKKLRPNGKRRSLFRRLRVKKRWKPSVSLSVDAGGRKHGEKGSGHGGQFVKGGGGISSLPKIEQAKSLEELHKQADELSSKIWTEHHPILHRMGAPVRMVRRLTKRLKTGMEARYGKAQTKAIFASGLAISWGAMAAGKYVPSEVAMVPALCLAEGYLQLKRGIGKLLSNEERQLSLREIHSLGKRLHEKILAAWDDAQEHEGSDDISLAVSGLPFARPKGWYRAPNPPKPGWVNVYTSPRGAKWWASPKNAAAGVPGSAAPTPAAPAPVAPPTPVLHRGANVIGGTPAAAPAPPPKPSHYQPPAPNLALKVAPYVGGKSAQTGLPVNIDHTVVGSFPNTFSSLSADFNQVTKPSAAFAFAFRQYHHTPSGYDVIASWKHGVPFSNQPSLYTITVLDGTGKVVSTYDSQAPRDESYVEGRAVQTAHWLEGELKKIANQKKSAAVAAPLAQFAWEYAQAAGVKPGVVPFSLSDTGGGNRTKIDGYLRSEFPKLIGAAQHAPHAGMDTIEHTNNILHPANLRTAGLPARDAEILRLGMVFHDVGKQYDPFDHDHPRKSAVDAEPLLWQFGLSPREVSDTLAVIKWHDAYGDQMRAGHGGAAVVAKLAYEYADDTLPPDKRKVEAHRINDLLMRAFQSDVSTIPGLTSKPIPGRPDLKPSGHVDADTTGPAFKAKVAKEIDAMAQPGALVPPPSSIPLPKKPPTIPTGTTPPDLVAPGLKWGEFVQRTDDIPVGEPVPYDSTKQPPSEVYREAEKNPDLNYARAFNMGYDGPTGLIVTAYHGTNKTAAGGILSTGIRAGNSGDNAFGHGVYAVVNGAYNIPSGYSSGAVVQMEVHTGRTISHDDLVSKVLPKWKQANPALAKKIGYSSHNAHLTAAALWAGYSTIAVAYGYKSNPTLVVLDPARIRLKSVVDSTHGGTTINTIHGKVTSKGLSAEEKSTTKGHPDYITVKNGVPKGWDGQPRTT